MIFRTINRGVTEAPLDACFAVLYAAFAILGSESPGNMIFNILFFWAAYEVIIRWKFKPTKTE